MSDRLKVLVSAYACNPYHGSEEGVGWGWVNAIAEHHDVWVIVGDLHRADIEKAVAADPERYCNIEFHYVARTRWLTLEKVWQPAYLWTYRLWQRAAYRLACELHEENKFDLAHLVTYVGFRVPGHLWRLDIPFVWGPIGGLENTPWRFLPMLGIKGCIYYACRNIINSLHKRFLTLPKRAFAKAGATGGIIAATEGIRKEILRWYGQESEVICEIGPPDTVAVEHSVRQPGEPLRLAWSGQHLPGKALPLLLRATAKLPAELDWRLDILGIGPCTKKWRRLATKLGVGGRCMWHGWVERAEAVDTVHSAHVFIITSMKDLTSTVLLEALSQGVPVICPDHCGFSNVVTDDCGVKVPVVTPSQIEGDIAEAIVEMASNEKRRDQMAAAAMGRIGAFSWESKATGLSTIY